MQYLQNYLNGNKKGFRTNPVISWKAALQRGHTRVSEHNKKSPEGVPDPVSCHSDMQSPITTTRQEWAAVGLLQILSLQILLALTDENHVETSKKV